MNKKNVRSFTATNINPYENSKKKKIKEGGKKLNQKLWRRNLPEQDE